MLLPNVSYCKDNNEVHYNPLLPETRLIVKFNVTDTDNPTAICKQNAVSSFSEIEIDGVVQPSVNYQYTFNTTGEHIVKYTLNDPTSIGSRAFYYCTGLTSVTIPNSVTSIGSSAFYNCSGLTSVTIPNSVTSIGESAFYYCKGLTSFTIPNSVTSLGSEVFKNCSSLTSIDIPNSVTSIGNFAFYNCKGLTSITIPSSVTSIGTDVFRGCSGITGIVIKATTPPSLGSSAFSNTNNCPIYVPSESVETYKAASGWSTYTSRIQAITV